MMRFMIMTAVLTGGFATARADKPSNKEVETTVRKLQTAVMADGDAAKAPNPKLAAEIIATPFSYAGFDYSSIDEAAMKRCKKKWGTAGKVKAADLPAFLDCAAIGLWGGALDGEADWAAADPNKLPKQLKKLKAQITKLAKDHAVVISHFQPAGPAESWNIYAATADGHIDTLISVNVSYAE